MMTDAERQVLLDRMLAIDAELAALADGRVVDGSPAEREATLPDEQDDIDWRRGMSEFERRDH